jgi:aarF domain-containing kinase
MSADIEGIKKYSEALGVGSFYGLFACMVTARSWESISTPGGVTKKGANKDEVLFIFLDTYLSLSLRHLISHLTQYEYE